jgi:uncharacterized membrane protein
MFLIGLLIMVAVAVFVGFVISDNWGGATSSISGFGHTLGHLTLAGIFIAGIASAAVFFIALWLVTVSSRMRRRASKSRRAETRAAREERDALQVERDRLSTELEAERASRLSATPVVVQPAVLVPAAVGGEPAVVEPTGVAPTVAEPTVVAPAVVTLPTDDGGLMGGATASSAGLGAVPGSGFHRVPDTSTYADAEALDESRRHTV